MCSLLQNGRGNKINTSVLGMNSQSFAGAGRSKNKQNLKTKRKKRKKELIRTGKSGMKEPTQGSSCDSDWETRAASHEHRNGSTPCPTPTPCLHAWLCSDCAEKLSGT